MDTLPTSLHLGPLPRRRQPFLYTVLEPANPASSAWGDFATCTPTRGIGQCLLAFLVVTAGRCYGHIVGRGQGCCQYPIMRSIAHSQDLSSPNKQVLRLRKLVLTLGGNTGSGSGVGFRASGCCLSQVGFLERAQAQVFKLGRYR